MFTACKDDGGNISPLQEVTPAFSWEENSFLLETDNGWGITRFSNRIALSNLVKSASTTSHGTVVPVREKKTKRCPEDSRSRKETANHPADKLLIEDIDGMYYNIHFQKDEKTGTLLLSK